MTHYTNIQREGSLVWLRYPRKLPKFAENILFYYLWSSLQICLNVSRVWRNLLLDPLVSKRVSQQSTVDCQLTGNISDSFPLCYYPHLHHSQARSKPGQARPGLGEELSCGVQSQISVSVGDIKQEPGSPGSGGEEGAWGEGGRAGDCLYDIVSSQTRFKEDNRNQIRWSSVTFHRDPI